MSSILHTISFFTGLMLKTGLAIKRPYWRLNPGASFCGGMELNPVKCVSEHVRFFWESSAYRAKSAAFFRL